MKYSIPFLYEAHIVKPRCRKLTPILVRAEHEVQIPQASLSDAPVAYSISRHGNRAAETRALNDKLWEPVGRDGTVASATSIISLLDKSWLSLAHKDYLPATPDRFDNWILTARDVTDGIYESAVSYRDWRADNKQAMVDKLNCMASAYVFIDGVLHTRVPEPYYFVRTFGQGGDHGSTFLLCGSHWDPGRDSDTWFGLNHYAEAVAYAEYVGRERGDSKSPSIVQNSYTVHLPEILKHTDNQIKPTAEFSW